VNALKTIRASDRACINLPGHIPPLFAEKTTSPKSNWPSKAVALKFSSEKQHHPIQQFDRIAVRNMTALDAITGVDRTK
jgi:hypothetical protein